MARAKAASVMVQRTRNMSDSRLIATLMTVVTLVLALSFVFSRLWLGDVRFNNKVIKEKNRVNEVLESNVTALPSLIENFRQLEQTGPKPAEVLAGLPLSSDYPAFGRELEAMAALAGTQLVAVVLETEGGASAPSDLPTPLEASFRIQVAGTWTNLQQFLRHLETAKRPIRINEASINGTEPTLSLEVEAVTYYQAVTSVAQEKEVIKE